MEDQVIKILADHSIRNTEIRRRILRIFVDSADKALSSQDIEDQIGSIDRVTLYRALRTFEEAGIVHQAIDGSQKTKYAFCGGGCTSHHHTDKHAHFRCVICESTFCLDMVNVPEINIPAGYQLHDSQMALTGVCNTCNTAKN